MKTKKENRGDRDHTGGGGGEHVGAFERGAKRNFNTIEKNPINHFISVKEGGDERSVNNLVKAFRARNPVRSW